MRTTAPSLPNAIKRAPMSMADTSRVRHRTRAMSSHRRFETIAGADGDELSSFLSKQFANSAGVAPPNRDAGKNQRSGIDFFAANLRFLVLLVNEGFESFNVDSRIVDVGS